MPPSSSRWKSKADGIARIVVTGGLFFGGLHFHCWKEGSLAYGPSSSSAMPAFEGREDKVALLELSTSLGVVLEELGSVAPIYLAAAAKLRVWLVVAAAIYQGALTLMVFALLRGKHALEREQVAAEAAEKKPRASSEQAPVSSTGEERANAAHLDQVLGGQGRGRDKDKAMLLERWVRRILMLTGALVAAAVLQMKMIIFMREGLDGLGTGDGGLPWLHAVAVVAARTKWAAMFTTNTALAWLYWALLRPPFTDPFPWYRRCYAGQTFLTLPTLYATAGIVGLAALFARGMEGFLGVALDVTRVAWACSWMHATNRFYDEQRRREMEAEGVLGEKGKSKVE
ncbi:unnamed protein product [Chrysoparadoxa australica]